MLECSPLGLGKGVLGVVARPVGGIVDFASSSFDGIQRWSCIQLQIMQNFYTTAYANTVHNEC